MTPLQIHQFLEKQLNGVNVVKRTVCVYHKGFGSTVSVVVDTGTRVGGTWHLYIKFIVNNKTELSIGEEDYFPDGSISHWIVRPSKTRITHLINPHNIFNYSLWSSLCEYAKCARTS